MCVCVYVFVWVYIYIYIFFVLTEKLNLESNWIRSARCGRNCCLPFSCFFHTKITGAEGRKQGASFLLPCQFGVISWYSWSMRGEEISCRFLGDLFAPSLFSFDFVGVQVWWLEQQSPPWGLEGNVLTSLHCWTNANDHPSGNILSGDGWKWIPFGPIIAFYSCYSELDDTTSAIVFVGNAAARKYHRLGGLNSRCLFLTAQEVGSPRSRCW